MIKTMFLTETARLPSKGSSQAAGWDVYSDERNVIQPGQMKLIRLGFATEMDPTTFGLLRPRSGLSSKGFTLCGSGIIDADYRGEWKFAAINLSPDPNQIWFINVGDRIGQCLILPVLNEEFCVADSLGESERGVGGFGSTGK